MYIGISLSSKYYTTILDALRETKRLGGNILQIYLGNMTLTTLREKYVLKKNEAKEIKKYLKENSMKIVIHAILTLNFCNDPNSPRNKWGIDNLSYDMNVCNQIGGIGCVIHMGTHKTPKIDISVEECMTNFINSLKMVLDQTKKVPIILETPVSRNNIVGGTLEGFAELFNKVPDSYKSRVRICVDTCHIYSSGYDIKTDEGSKEYFDKFNKLIGFKNLYLIHLNDSKTPLDSHIDRHAPIGQGYIFNESNYGTLPYLINLSYENNIPMVLETSYENFKSEIKLVKSMVNADKTVQTIIDIKPLIIDIFQKILKFHESLGKAGNMSTKFRINSYRKAIKSLNKFEGPIYNAKNIKDFHIEGIGKGFKDKIDEIAKTGTLKIYENIKSNPNTNAMNIFLKIWGVGPEKAREILSKNIRTIAELKKIIYESPQTKISLTDSQLLGLKYYTDLNKKIPREEITELTNEISKILINIDVYNAGSYRLGKKYSSDIDLIVLCDKATFLKMMGPTNIIRDVLSNGTKKSIYIIKYKSNPFRQMDVAFIKKEDLPWYLLYFGSSRDFSKKIRLHALSMGYKLNERGLFDKKSGKIINFNPKNEAEIFKYLGLKYIKPENRD